ncbi:MAG: chorismate mutase [Rickettsiales bacterium]|nr:chorismate mutase [Rickettsiales bacterium]
MENQHNKNSKNSLTALRSEIDKIDNQIIDLLKQRMAVVSDVGELKKANNEKFFIKSSREADMIKELIKKLDFNFPKSAIINIWRKIIVAANMHEQPLNIVVHNPKNISDYSYLVKEYYNDEVPLIFHDSVANVVLEMEKGKAQIGIFALPKADEMKSDLTENWWINLANNKLGIKVFAKIPFIEFDKKSRITNDIELVAVAIKEAEQSIEDNSLIYVEVDKNVTKDDVVSALKTNGLKAKILKSVKSPQVENIVFYLIELQGFFTENDAMLKSFAKSEIKPFAKVLGSYALPIRI